MRRLRRTLQFAFVLACLVGALTLSIAVTRAIAHGPLERTAPGDCAGADEFARHTSLEIEACVVRALRADVDRRGVLPAMIALQRRANRNPALKMLCHLAVHELGREQQRSGLPVGALAGRMPRDANWNSSCTGAFLHGYLQAMSAESDVPALLAAGRRWCAGLDTDDLRGCAHAVGHGLSRRRANDLGAAAADCRRMPAPTRHDCLSGAVMELNFADPRLGERMVADPDVAAASDVDCRAVAASQRTWCRALVVKGEGLIFALRTVA